MTLRKIRILWLRRSLKKSKCRKKMPTESKSAYLFISKTKENNFRDSQRKYRNQMTSCKRKINLRKKMLIIILIQLQILYLIRMSLKMKILMNFSYFLFTLGYFPKPMEKKIAKNKMNFSFSCKSSIKLRIVKLSKRCWQTFN